MPPLLPSELSALRESIEAHGVQVPVLVDEHGTIIDGNHRDQIATELGIDCPREVRTGLTEADKRALAISLNRDRRHLTRSQVQELVAQSVKADPHLSDREHGRRTGVDHKTAAVIRGQLAERGEIPHLATRTDSLGRHQPAAKPDRAAQAVESYPELQHYRDKGDDRHAVRIAEALDGMPDSERNVRREALAGAIAADKRGTLTPTPDPTDAILAAADRVFLAANAATRELRMHGDRLADAVPHADRLLVSTWHDEFADLANLCNQLAAACVPQGLRVVK